MFVKVIFATALLLAAPSFATSSETSSPCASYAPATHNTTYPSKHTICNIFKNLVDGDGAGFFSHVSPTVNWTIEGTQPLSGVYTNRTILEASFARIEAVASAEHPFAFSIVNIIGGGNEEWSVQELQVQTICRNGLFFDNRYSWATRWNADGVIVQVRAYLDSALVAAAIVQNEAANLFTYSDERTENMPYVTQSEELLKQATGLRIVR